MVEAAISLTLFFMLVFGIVGFGRGVWAYSWASHAAREATRWACVRGEASGHPTTSGAVSDFVKQHAPGLDQSRITVSTTWPDGDQKAGHVVQVTVQYNVTKLVPYVPAMTVSSRSQMPIAQ
jgi:Flp pilus assembly protein TadG